MGKRCQVCDGPVVNGRCKYCGMPYRNDLELYHLNEDRSEHYRHASAKVRKAMAESEIPLPDRNKTANKSSKTSTVKKTVPKAKTEKVQTSVKKASAGQNVGTRTYTTNRNPVQKRKEKKKSKKGATVFWIIVVILLSVAAQTEEYWDSIGYRIESFINDEFGINPGSVFQAATAMMGKQRQKTGIIKSVRLRNQPRIFRAPNRILIFSREKVMWLERII